MSDRDASAAAGEPCTGPAQGRVDGLIDEHSDPRLPCTGSAVNLVTRLKSEGREPIDVLVARLITGGSAVAMLDAAETGAERLVPGVSWRVLTASHAGLDTLKAARRAYKAVYRRAEVDEYRSTALLGYLLTVASGIVNHRVQLSTLDDERLEDWLEAAGAVADLPVASLFRKAAAALGEPGGY